MDTAETLEPVTSPAPSEPEPEPESEPESEPEGSVGGGVAEEYVTALASGDLDEMRDAIDLTAEDSVARTYMRFQRSLHEADQAQGMGSYRQDMTELSDGYELCFEDDYDDSTEECVTFADFETDSDGMLAQFTVNGERLGERLVSGGQTDSVGDNEVRLIGGYHSVQSDTFNIAVRVDSGSEPWDIFASSAEYVTPDGRQIMVTYAVEPTNYQPNARQILTMQFDNAEPGGRLIIPASSPDYMSDGELTFDL